MQFFLTEVFFGLQVQFSDWNKKIVVNCSKSHKDIELLKGQTIKVIKTMNIHHHTTLSRESLCM